MSDKTSLECNPVRYRCLRVPEGIPVGGTLPTEVWRAAPWFDAFVDLQPIPIILVMVK
jgi:hypothetical protein